MLEVLGGTLPFAVGMMLSPFPLIASVLVLLSPSGRLGGVAFALGRLVGVAAISLSASLLSEVITIKSGSSMASALLRIVLGLGLLGLTVVKWRKRPGAAEEAALPRWMSSIQAAPPLRAAVLALLITVANPKELAFGIGAGLTIGGAGLAPAPTVALALIFAVTACLSVIVPVVGFVVAGDRLKGRLEAARDWLVVNNNVIISVVFLVLGSVLVGQGLGVL